MIRRFVMMAVPDSVIVHPSSPGNVGRNLERHTADATSALVVPSLLLPLAEVRRHLHVRDFGFLFDEPRHVHRSEGGRILQRMLSRLPLRQHERSLLLLLGDQGPGLVRLPLSMVEGGFRSVANDYDAIGLGTPAGLVRKTADDVGEYRQGFPPPVSLGLEIDRDIAMVRSVRGIDDSRCRGLVA